MKHKLLGALALATTLVLAGCSGATDSSSSTDKASETERSAAERFAENSDSGATMEVIPTKPATGSGPIEATVVDSGVMFDGEWLEAVALIELSDGEVQADQTLTVTMKIQDAAGKEIYTLTQLPEVQFANQTMVVSGKAGTTKDVEPASVDVQVVVSEGNGPAEVREPLPTIISRDFTEENGEWTPFFEWKNELTEETGPMQIETMCTNAAGEVVGIGWTYVPSMDAGAEKRVDPTSLAAPMIEKPAQCLGALRYQNN